MRTVGPFGVTLESHAPEAGEVHAHTHGGSKAGNPVPGEQAIIAQFADHAVRLGPLVKRRMFDFAEVPGKLTLGWAQLPSANYQGNVFSLGLFASNRDSSSPRNARTTAASWDVTSPDA